MKIGNWTTVDAANVGGGGQLEAGGYVIMVQKVADHPDEGYLDVTTGVDVKKNEGGEIGTYLVEVSSVTGLTSVTLKPNETEQVASFRILTKDGTPLGDGNKIKIDKKFTHLGLVSTDLAELEIEFYDEGDSLKYKGRFDTTNKKLLKKEDLTQ